MKRLDFSEVERLDLTKSSCHIERSRDASAVEIQDDKTSVSTALYLTFRVSLAIVLSNRAQSRFKMIK